MFKIEEKEYDETKLEGKAAIEAKRAEVKAKYPKS